MKNKKYMTELRKLQVELAHLQRWVKEKGLRVIIVLEGRDGAGKGGTIKAITERVSPRVFRVVALPAPSDREKSQLYLQRYFQHFPAAGEVVIFDRSWYNRAGVERVMGFCTDRQYERFLTLCPAMEKFMVTGGIMLIKLWLEVSNDEQKRRFEARIADPLRQWKLSPMDLPSREKWYQVLGGQGSHAEGDRREGCALVPPPVGRQEARASERDRPYPVADPVQEAARAEDRSARPVDQGRLRRREDDQATAVREGTVLEGLRAEGSGPRARGGEPAERA